MRTTAGVLALFAVLLAASTGVGAAGAAAGYASCSGGFNPDGSSGSFYTMINAKRVGCTSAKKVVKAWVVKKSAGGNPTTAVTVKGFACRGRSTAAARTPTAASRSPASRAAATSSSSSGNRSRRGGAADRPPRASGGREIGFVT